MRRRALAVLAVMLGVLLGVGSGALPASAHAELLSTTPADGAVLEKAPESAELRFNEPVQLIEGAIQLFPGDGSMPIVLDARTVDSTVTADLPHDLADGSYVIGYRVVSVDGHPIGGGITFRIGQGAETATTPSAAGFGTTPAETDTAVSVLTVLQYLGLLVFSGLLFFDRIVLRRREAADRGFLRLVTAAFGVAALAAVLLVLASALRVVGGHLADVFSPSTWLPGILWQPVAAALIITGAGLFAVLLVRRPTGAGWVVVAAAAVAVVTPVLVGHTQTVQPGWLVITADLGHLLAGAFWAGGVVGLLRYLAAARPGAAGAEPRIDPVVAARVAVRFSRFALASVVVLAVSGTIMAVLIIGSWDAVLGTGYGRTLLLKLGIVAAVVVLAAWNRTRLLPRITARPTAALQWTSLRRILSYEAALLIAVIAITGFLTNSSPSHDHNSSAAAPVAADTTVHAESQGLTVDGRLSPTTAGQNTLSFRLEYDGAPVAIDEIDVSARLPAQQLGPFEAAIRLDSATGDYQAVLTTPISGEWQLQITARVDEFTQPIAIIPITIP
ncbi:copper resistance protein CopC [uncultured Microbacterium sp.]|uniref:copper resistance protein CopC n=1 Tax=uncultured Microbacterium sp. TaxID=191216 RepID=UPI0035C9744F